MKKLLIVLLTVTAWIGCKEKCDTYHVDPPECVSWASRFSGTWSTEDTVFCSNGTPFGGSLVLAEHNAPNLLKLDNNSALQLTVTSETIAEGGPYTLGDENGTWTVRFRATYTPYRAAISGSNQLGQVTPSTPAMPESVLWEIWRNEGTENELYCPAVMKK